MYRKFITCMVIFAMVLFISGCNSTKTSPDLGPIEKPNLEKVQENLDDTQKVLEETVDVINTETPVIDGAAIEIDGNADDIKVETESIRGETTKGREKAPELTEWPQIDAHTNTIDTKSDEIKALAESIRQSASRITALENKLTQANIEIEKSKGDVRDAVEKFNGLEEKYADSQKSILELEKKNNELASAKEEMRQKIWIALMGFCAVAVGIGVVMIVFAQQMKLGGSVIVAALFMFGIVYLMANYAIYLMFAALGLSVIFAGAMIYDKYCDRKALEESVESMEVLRKEDDNVWKKKKEDIGKIQSTRTKKIVHDIKLKKDSASV